MRDISFSTVGFMDRGTEEALDAVAEAGFTQTEIIGQDPHMDDAPTGRALSEFRARLEARGLRVRTVHAPMKRNVLGAPDEDWRREKVRVSSRFIEFAGEVGAGEVVIHPVPNPMFVADADDPSVPGRIRDAVPRSLDEIVPVAQAAGVRITLENLPYHCDYPFLTMRELRPVVDAYPEDGLGLVIDTGHAWTMKNDPVEEIRAAGSRLCGTHLQDVDYDEPDDDHWVPTHGDLNWDSIRAAFVEIEYAGPWTFECYVPRHGESPEELASITHGVAESWGL